MNNNFIKAGVVLKSKFVVAGDEKFSKYIEYVDRDKAIRNEHFAEYSAYVDDYMDDKKKRDVNYRSDRTSALFTKDLNRLDPEQKKILKDQFTTAQKNQSVMWQNVISFDNRWLEKYGNYKSETGQVNLSAIQNATRAAMAEKLSAEGLETSAVWSASVHYNTDNIHVHVAVVEPEPTRPLENFRGKMERRGMLKLGTLQKMKSKVVNDLADRSIERNQINDIIRNNIVATSKCRNLKNDNHLANEYVSLYNSLPQNNKRWFYNAKHMVQYKPLVDNFSKKYLETYHKEDYKKLDVQLRREVGFFKEAYGTSKEFAPEQYAKTKIQDLYTRLGNSVLTSLRGEDLSKENKLTNFEFEELPSVENPIDDSHPVSKVSQELPIIRLSAQKATMFIIEQNNATLNQDMVLSVDVPKVEVRRRDDYINETSFTPQRKSDSDFLVRKSFYQLKKAMRKDFNQISNNEFEYERLQQTMEYNSSVKAHNLEYDY